MTESEWMCCEEYEAGAMNMTKQIHAKLDEAAWNFEEDGRFSQFGETFTLDAKGIRSQFLKLLHSEYNEEEARTLIDYWEQEGSKMVDEDAQKKLRTFGGAQGDLLCELIFGNAWVRGPEGDLYMKFSRAAGTLFMSARMGKENAAFNGNDCRDDAATEKLDNTVDEKVISSYEGCSPLYSQSGLNQRIDPVDCQTNCW